MAAGKSSEKGDDEKRAKKFFGARNYAEGPLEVAMREARLHNRCKRQRQNEAGSALKSVTGRTAMEMGISIREV